MDWKKLLGGISPTVATALRHDEKPQMKTLTTLLLSLLAGCSALPTAQQCEYVKYERREQAIYFTAHCHTTPEIVGWMLR